VGVALRRPQTRTSAVGVALPTAPTAEHRGGRGLDGGPQRLKFGGGRGLAGMTLGGPRSAHPVEAVCALGVLERHEALVAEAQRPAREVGGSGGGGGSGQVAGQHGDEATARQAKREAGAGPFQAARSPLHHQLRQRRAQLLRAREDRDEAGGRRGHGDGGAVEAQCACAKGEGAGRVRRAHAQYLSEAGAGPGSSCSPAHWFFADSAGNPFPGWGRSPGTLLLIIVGSTVIEGGGRQGACLGCLEGLLEGV
jgi:hypothetical protein